MHLVRSLKAVALAHAAAVVLQPVLAGLYLDGSITPIRIHQHTAYVAFALATAQLLLATMWWRSRRSAGPMIGSAAIVGAESVQFALGYSRLMTGHVPLGIAIFAGTVAFTVWAVGVRSTEVTA